MIILGLNSVLLPLVMKYRKKYYFNAYFNPNYSNLHHLSFTLLLFYFQISYFHHYLFQERNYPYNVFIRISFVIEFK